MAVVTNKSCLIVVAAFVGIVLLPIAGVTIFSYTERNQTRITKAMSELEGYSSCVKGYSFTEPWFFSDRRTLSALLKKGNVPEYREKLEEAKTYCYPHELKKKIRAKEIEYYLSKTAADDVRNIVRIIQADPRDMKIIEVCRQIEALGFLVEIEGEEILVKPTLKEPVGGEIRLYNRIQSIKHRVEDKIRLVKLARNIADNNKKGE
ncbi:MAG: hypothetical protein JKY89_05990 [Immundisolibacteraceae bacterium]|nr:hypothetical protein [Immundisolibacteraceae bacterium]